MVGVSVNSYWKVLTVSFSLMTRSIARATVYHTPASSPALIVSVFRARPGGLTKVIGSTLLLFLGFGDTVIFEEGRTVTDYIN